MNQYIITIPCLMMYHIVSVLFLLFVWCPGMGTVYNYKGGLVLYIILLTQYLATLNVAKCHEEVFSSQPMIPPKRFDIFPADYDRGCSEGLDAFMFTNSTF